MKKSDIKRIIRRVVSESKSEKRDKQLRGIAAQTIEKVFLKEHTIPNKEADINDMDASAVWDIMTGEDIGAAQDLIDRIGSATGWGGGALKKAGITGETLKWPTCYWQVFQLRWCYQCTRSFHSTLL